jgi:hypothetical protein
LLPPTGESYPLLPGGLGRRVRAFWNAYPLSNAYPQDAPYLVATQDLRQLSFSRRPDEVEDLPLAAQRALGEELDATQGDGEAGPREVLDLREVEEILAQVVLLELVGRTTEMDGELADRADVGFLGAWGGTPEAAGRRACVGGVASWRPLSGRLGPPRTGCVVTSLAGRGRGTLANVLSAIRRRRIEFNSAFNSAFDRSAGSPSLAAAGQRDRYAH